MRWCVLWKNCFTIFNVKVTARAYMIKIWLFLLYFLNCGPFATKLGLIVQDHKRKCPVVKKGLLHSRSRSQRRFKMSVNVCQDIFPVCPIVSTQYLLNCSTIFLPKLVWWCVIMRRCVMRKIGSLPSRSSHSKGLYNSNMTIFTVCSKLLVCLQPNLVS